MKIGDFRRLLDILPSCLEAENITFDYPRYNDIHEKAIGYDYDSDFDEDFRRDKVSLVELRVPLESMPIVNVPGIVKTISTPEFDRARYYKGKKMEYANGLKIVTYVSLPNGSTAALCSETAFYQMIDAPYLISHLRFNLPAIYEGVQPHLREYIKRKIQQHKKDMRKEISADEGHVELDGEGKQLSVKQKLGDRELEEIRLLERALHRMDAPSRGEP